MTPHISRRTFLLLLLSILILAGIVRGIFPLADPPSDGSAGVVWHDEGAWVHNARNRVLFGTWMTDAWNPLFITPVLTGLEYVSFQTFGVGLWQARLVSQVLGVLSVLALAAGVTRIANPVAGLIAGALLATSYTYVTYNRAAVMEATMVAFLVVAWWCYVRASDTPAWGIVAAAAAFLAYFSKASAVFFVVALGLDAVVSLLSRHGATEAKASAHVAEAPAHIRRGAVWTLAGLVAAGSLALIVFVMPNWDQYRFYNWETSVTRRPSYSLTALKDRLTWFPIVHDFFTRMWPVTILALCALASIQARIRALHPGERVLVWWIGLGTLELIARDVGNERYFVYLIPALVALAALALGRDRRLLALEPASTRTRRGLLFAATPLLVFALYVGVGSVLRVAFRVEIFALHDLQWPVRLSAAIAALLTLATLVTWPRIPRVLSRVSWSVTASATLAALIVVIDLVQFGWWASGRTYKNHAAMRAIAEWLPPDTLVHGKLANGLSLESRIRPIFVGRNFGNFEDRFTRDDVRYVVTYVSPSLAYEGPVIREVLEAYPDRRVLKTFDVSETPSGHDQAALFEKWPGAGQGRKRHE